MNTRNWKTKTILTLFPVLLWAEDPVASLPILGQWWNAETKQLERLEGLPGSLRHTAAPPEGEARYWSSAHLLLERRGAELKIHDLATGSVLSESVDGDWDFVFSSDGRRWQRYASGAARPFLLNDGTLLDADHDALLESGGILYVRASGALVELERHGVSWVERRRHESPLFSGLLSLKTAGEALLLLNADGELLRWRAGQAEAETLARGVSGLESLRQESFYRLQGKTGSRLLYLDSPGQRVYDLGATAVEVRQ